MLQIVEQTKEEKMAMYMKLPKKQIVEMLINCNDIITALTQAKNCVIPAVMVELPDNHVCRYSKAMNQPHPRLCIICGKPEGN
jgi:hypothetical protein